jgi:hypothetical protein
MLSKLCYPATHNHRYVVGEGSSYIRGLLYILTEYVRNAQYVRDAEYTRNVICKVQENDNGLR